MRAFDRPKASSLRSGREGGTLGWLEAELAWVEDVFGVQGCFDPAHYVHAGAVLLGHEVGVAQSSAVHVLHRAAEGLHLVEEAIDRGAQALVATVGCGEGE